MSWWLLLFGPLLVFLLSLLINDLRAYLKGLKYKAQGFLFSYIPVVGNSSLMFPNPQHPEDSLYNYKAELNKAEGFPGLVTNSAYGGSAAIHLTDTSLFREFLLKEDQITTKFELVKLEKNFLMDSSERGFHHRLTFSEMFRLDHIDSMIAGLRQDNYEFLDGMENLIKKSKNLEESSQF